MDSSNSPDVVAMIDGAIYKLIDSGDVKMSEENSNHYDGLTITYDMTGVDYISSAFMRTCMIFAKRVEKDAFAVVNTSPMIKKTLKIANLDQVMRIE
jgi:anti-anti-sigma factor